MSPPYTLETLQGVAREFFREIAESPNVEVASLRLLNRVTRCQMEMPRSETVEGRVVRVRDCARAIRGICLQRAEKLSGFSVIRALFELSHNRQVESLQEGFFAEMIHIFAGLQSIYDDTAPGDFLIPKKLSGREAAIARSSELDRLGEKVAERFGKYSHGLDNQVISMRAENRRRILSYLKAPEEDWFDWKWQVGNIFRKAESVSEIISLDKDQLDSLRHAIQAGLPFGITPYYLSLMDRCSSDSDRAVRAQVLPPKSYVEKMAEGRSRGLCSFDFMLEKDTSPIDLITRRYPSIVILKPFNACPQVCVYCQRNWEIDEVMAKNAKAPREKLKKALNWIRDHPVIREVLVTGGDPLAMEDDDLIWVLDGLASIPTVERIRVGTRTLVTMPMRISPELVAYLAELREPLRRDVSVVTHVQYPYEITPEMHEAVEKLRSAKIAVYNQNVFTFHISRRFECAFLRTLLKKIGIDPYYTFNTKGKQETGEYRVPIARLLQEQKEEARLLPGLDRTDETVYNVPGLGKNYLRALQHRQLLSILPDGSRVYEFHPWEKNIVDQKTYVATDVPILDYLKRLESIGEDPSDYQTIWYYY